MLTSKDVQQRLEDLQEKYNAMGQDMVSYLDGLLYADYLTYWEYIHLDTLLTLQNPKTSFPDEEIFIMYHQITELYFKLTLHELKQITESPNLTVSFLKTRIKRINCYFENLTRSFEIMVNGMEVDQFLKFRMTLLPASGFQSAQYRIIEIYATPFIELVDKELKEEFRKKENVSVREMYDNIYWKKGATELATNKKTLTLKRFEEKYSEQIIDTAENLKGKTLYDKFLGLSPTEQQDEELVKELKQFDLNVNVNWPLSHYKSAVRYLQKDPEDIKATGGTNWQKYLPPRFQLRIFYPQLWSKEELQEWGKGYRDM